MTPFRDALIAAMKCPTSGKSCYVDEATADEHLERFWTRRSKLAENGGAGHYGRMPYRSYLCPDCGWWHHTASREART